MVFVGWRRLCINRGRPGTPLPYLLLLVVFGSAYLLCRSLYAGTADKTAAANGPRGETGAHAAARTARTFTCPYALAAVVDYLPVIASAVAVPAPAEWEIQGRDPPVIAYEYPSWATWTDAATVPHGMTWTEARGMKVGPSALFEGIVYSLNNAANALPSAGLAPLHADNKIAAAHPGLDRDARAAAAPNLQSSSAQMVAALLHSKEMIHKLAELAFDPKHFARHCNNDAPYQDCMRVVSEDSTEYPGRLIWQSLRRVIGGPTAIEYPAPPLPEQMGFLAPAHQQGDEQGGQREPTAWEEQLYLEIRNAVIVLQSPALHNLLNNDEVDSACTARHTSAIYKSVGERVHPENSAHGTNTRARGDSQRTAIADRHRQQQQQQQQQQKRIQFGNLGTIEGGMLLPDMPAIDPGRKQVSYAYVPAKKIPRIGLGLGCPRVSEARYFLTEYYTDTKGKSRQGVDDAVQSLIEAALQAGYRLFDTAQMYLNEAILGKALVASATPRSEVFIITKLNDECEEFESLATERIEDWTLQHTVAVHRYVRKTVAEQLERLQTSYIDMYCIHHTDLPGDVGLRGASGDPRLDATLETLQVLQAEGTIVRLMHGNAGTSNVHPLPRANGDGQGQSQLHRYPAAVEEQHSVFRRKLDPSKVRMRAAGTVLIGIVQMDGFPDSMPPLMSSHVRSIADRLKKTSAQILTRWSVQSGVVSIPCTFNKQHLLDNSPPVIGSFSLTDTDMKLLDSIALMGTR